MFTKMDKASNYAYSFAIFAVIVYLIWKPAVLGVVVGGAGILLAITIWILVFSIPVLIALALIKYLVKR